MKTVYFYNNNIIVIIIFITIWSHAIICIALSVDEIGFVYFFLSLCYTHTIHDRNEWSASFGKQTIVHFLIFFFYLIITWKVKYKTYFLNVHILDGFLLVPTQARVRFYFCLPLLNSYVKPFWLFFSLIIIICLYVYFFMIITLT